MVGHQLPTKRRSRIDSSAHKIPREAAFASLQISTASKISAPGSSDLVLPPMCWLEGCSIAASSRCGKCKVARYCSSEHQLEHWKAGHKADCSTTTVTFPVTRAAALGSSPTPPMQTPTTVSPGASKKTTPAARAPGPAGGASAAAFAEPRGSYPTEPLIAVHADPTLELFREPTRQDRKLLQCEQRDSWSGGGG